MTPAQLASQIRALPGYLPSNLLGSIALLLDLLPPDATPAQVAEYTAGLPAAEVVVPDVSTVPVHALPREAREAGRDA